MTQPIFVGFRATAAEAEKLESLAQASRRTKSAIMRILLAQAALAETPDVRLEPEAEQKRRQSHD